MKSRRTILIVDGDPPVREATRNLLEAEGFAVAEASNGAEAILWLQKRTADLILLDPMVPVMDGRSFLEYRSRQAKMRKIPVLVLSGRLDDPGARELLQRLGAHRILPKPVGRKELIAAIRKGLATPAPIPAGPPQAAEAVSERQDPRVAFSVPIRARPSSSPDVTGTLRDLSAGGAGVYLPRRLPLQTAIQVSLDLKGHFLALAGYVQWAAARQNGRGFQHGIRFAEKQEDAFPLYTYSFFRAHVQTPKGK